MVHPRWGKMVHPGTNEIEPPIPRDTNWGKMVQHTGVKWSSRTEITEDNMDHFTPVL